MSQKKNYSTVILVRSQVFDDIPENYHIVTIDLEEKDKQTTVTLTQNNNADEKTKDHSEKNWKMMLASLKKLLEKPY